MQPKGSYPDKTHNAIAGFEKFEIKVTQLQGKVKIGQNKSTEDLEGVIKALKNTSSEQELVIPDLIKTYLKSKD